MQLNHTYHPVGDETEQQDWSNSYWDEITEDFRQEEAGHSIVATGVLMTVKGTQNIEL